MATHVFHEEAAIAEPQDPLKAMTNIMETVKKEAGAMFSKEKIDVSLNHFN